MNCKECEKKRHKIKCLDCKKDLSVPLRIKRWLCVECATGEKREKNVNVKDNGSK